MEHAHEHPGFLHSHQLKGGKSQWLHMSVDNAETATFLTEDAQLNDQIVEALLEEDTRSRIRITDNGIMVLLKATLSKSISSPSPDEMITMRVWIDRDRVISTQEMDADPIRTVFENLTNGEGPETPTSFLTELVDLHISSLDQIVENLEEDLQNLDELVLQQKLDEMCTPLAEVQKRATMLLRHLTPQRAVLERLATIKHPLIDEKTNVQFDGYLNHLLRLLETLLAIRERSDILHAQHERILDRDQNKTAHLFAVIATVFLPLGFITGMWGVNLEGIPMSSLPNGFMLLLLASLVLMVLLMVVFRFRRWF